MDGDVVVFIVSDDVAELAEWVESPAYDAVIVMLLLGLEGGV